MTTANLTSDAFWRGYRYAAHGCPLSMVNPFDVGTSEHADFELGAHAASEDVHRSEAWQELQRECTE